MAITDMFSLKGKTALITGGAGYYGKQLLRGLAEAGAKVYTASRNVAKLQLVADELNKEGYDVTALKFDQGDKQSITALKNEILKDVEKVDILVNNAVYRSPSGMDNDWDELTKNNEININGLQELSKIFGNHMAKNKNGSIINIASIYGIVGYDAALYVDMPFDGLSPYYYYTKGGMVNYTKFLAGYYGLSNVRVNCVSPGGLESDLTPKSFVERYSKKTCLGRMANKTDLMGTIVFLASDASKYITGANIPVDGGLSAK